jgi:hypothetical protein
MAIGIQPAASGLNIQLGNTAIALRNDFYEVIDLWDYITALGANEAAQVTALGTLGFSTSGSPSDAQNFWTMANYLYAVAQLYFGQINQATAFDYDSATAIVRGGN